MRWKHRKDIGSSTAEAYIRNADVGLAAVPSISIRMTMAVVGVLPIVLLYPFIQSNFVKEITLGGVKG